MEDSCLIIILNVQRAHRLFHSFDELSSQIERNFTVQEAYDSDGCFTLTFGKRDLKYMKDPDGIELVYHEILLRDPIVRKFARSSNDYWERYRAVIRTEPLRIVNTRWKIKNVLDDYLAEAWGNSATHGTFIREWDKDEFNKDYENPSDTVKPTEAVRAALWVFYVTNEKSVKDRLP
ncbi:hypothetical protein BC938DRAFT_480076 [Jimgerdemannia flammicorona]|uniref:Uncharacterized protein n=1 Tax=Jimgerdemannia flammicorona TaxID=994334 RepID=A0A433QJH3_9FUNG|nr:hypothetical protein BC938DRAFT_480076 [Jimgerdemannia flammicorona]